MGSHWTKSKGPGELASDLAERMKNERSRVVNEPAMETEQRVLDGDILLGYAVRGGEIVGRIKDTMLHCNLYEVLRQVRGIGSEVDELGGATRVAGDCVRWGFHLARWRILSRMVFNMRPWGAHIRSIVEDS